MNLVPSWHGRSLQAGRWHARLFIAPVLLDAAFDFPVGAAQTLWRPLAMMAIGAVLVTTAAVAWVGVAAMGLLEGKNIVITGVLTDASLAFGVASLAQREGAKVMLTSAGRALSLTERTARKLPEPAASVSRIH